MENGKIIRGNGKLLLTGEYSVLDGATALALPTRYGQTMMLVEGDSDVVSWESIDLYNEVWLSAIIDKNSGVLIQSDDSEAAKTLQKLLSSVLLLSPEFLENIASIRIKSDFPLTWGLGSSSTLIYAISAAAGLNPYPLQESLFGGSGYDIACAGSKDPILFQRLKEGAPLIRAVNFEPTFPDRMAFVYLGRKQNSRDAIRMYKQRNNVSEDLIKTISNISEIIAHTDDHHLIITLLKEHEAIMSDQLGKQAVQDQFFTDFEGVVKSLGAWGGDFVLAVHHHETIDPVYFYKKGYPTVVPYRSMIL
jgi:mevalonate kinase